MSPNVSAVICRRRRFNGISTSSGNDAFRLPDAFAGAIMCLYFGLEFYLSSRMLLARSPI